MHKDLRQKVIQSSFLGCEKDTETILRQLFANQNIIQGFANKTVSEVLKRLLVINTKDCIDDWENEIYNAKIAEMNLIRLYEEGYIKIAPLLAREEHAEKQTCIFISFDNFVPNSSNTEFRDNTITFDVLCNPEDWDIGNYRLRPIKICGIIDGILNKTKLSGIGTLQFMGMNELILDESLAGYSLTFAAIHETEGDDKVENG